MKKTLKEKLYMAILLFSKCLWTFINSFIEPFKAYVYEYLSFERK